MIFREAKEPFKKPFKKTKNLQILIIKNKKSGKTFIFPLLYIIKVE